MNLEYIFTREESLDSMLDCGQLRNLLKRTEKEKFSKRSVEHIVDVFGDNKNVTFEQFKRIWNYIGNVQKVFASYGLEKLD